jgi:hypothetical protein
LLEAAAAVLIAPGLAAWEASAAASAEAVPDALRVPFLPEDVFAAALFILLERYSSLYL